MLCHLSPSLLFILKLFALLSHSHLYITPTGTPYLRHQSLLYVVSPLSIITFYSVSFLHSRLTLLSSDTCPMLATSQNLINVIIGQCIIRDRSLNTIRRWKFPDFQPRKNSSPPLWILVQKFLPLYFHSYV